MAAPTLVKKSGKRKTDKQLAKEYSLRDQYDKLKREGALVLTTRPTVSGDPTQRSQRIRKKLNKRKNR